MNKSKSREMDETAAEIELMLVRSIAERGEVPTREHFGVTKDKDK